MGNANNSEHNQRIMILAGGVIFTLCNVQEGKPLSRPNGLHTFHFLAAAVISMMRLINCNLNLKISNQNNQTGATS